eukprot:766873-Hanusia_phi.AAC.1
MSGFTSRCCPRRRGTIQVHYTGGSALCHGFSAHWPRQQGDDHHQSRSNSTPLHSFEIFKSRASDVLTPPQPGDDELCMRKLPLVVLMYEAIIEDVLDYDYAPVAVNVCHDGISRNVWMNVTQEGMHALDDFISKNLCRNIKLQSKDFSAVTAYQITEKGLNFLARAPKEILMAVDDFLYRSGDVLQVRFNGSDFEIYTSSGFSQESGVTDTEDVSYVSSPWLPQTLRYTSKPLRSFAHRAYEAAEGISQLHDELDSAIRLRNVNLLVAEWIPLGPNQLWYLMERLGVLDRCQVVALRTFCVLMASCRAECLQRKWTTTLRRASFSVPSGLLYADDLPSEMTKSRASFRFGHGGCCRTRSERELQVEYFGMHMDVDGGIMIGLKVEAIEKSPAEQLSIDLISRLVVDIMNDSSRIIDDLLSEYQRVQVDCTWSGLGSADDG